MLEKNPDLTSYLKPTVTILEEYWRISRRMTTFGRSQINPPIMRIKNLVHLDEQNREAIHSEYSYSPRLDAALKLILNDPAFFELPGTPSIKFLRAARFLKTNAPHAFQIREMGALTKSNMDRWLWDLLSSEASSKLENDREGLRLHHT
jgi:hypothetical protein